MPMPMFPRRARPLVIVAALAYLAIPAAVAADPAGSATAASATAAAPAAAVPATAPAAVAPAPTDPTAAVVAQGNQIYRQRDLDALIAIAQRYAKNKLDQNSCDALRQTLVRILVAREAFNAGVAEFPPALNGKARDAFVLDLLDYQAEAVPATAAAPVTAAPAPVAAQTGAPAATVIVNLPPMTLSRTIDKVGRRQLVIGLSLLFPDAATAKSFEGRAALIRDCLLGCAQQLAPTQFVDPDQGMLKTAFVKAIQTKIPEFPNDSVLIPQLDAGPVETAAPAP